MANLVAPLLGDVELRPDAELAGHDLGGPRPHVLLDVAAREANLLAVAVDSTHDDVDVGMVRVVVVDRRPDERAA